MLFDVGMGPHGGVEVDRVAVLVGVEAPVAIVEGGEQAALGSGVQRFTADDAAGALGSLGVEMSDVSSHTAAPSRGLPS